MPPEKKQINLVFAPHSTEGIKLLKEQFQQFSPDLFLSEAWGYSQESLEKLRKLANGEISVDEYFGPLDLFGTASRSVMDADKMIAGTGVKVDFVDVNEHHSIFIESNQLPEDSDMVLPSDKPWRNIYLILEALKELLPDLGGILRQHRKSAESLATLYEMLDELPLVTSQPSGQVEVVRPHLTTVSHQLFSLYGEDPHPISNVAYHWRRHLEAESRFIDRDREALFEREIGGLNRVIVQQGQLIRQREEYIIREFKQKVDHYQAKRTLAYFGTAHTTMKRALQALLGNEYEVIMPLSASIRLFLPLDEAQRLVIIGKEVPEDLLAKGYIQRMTSEWVREAIQPFFEKGKVRANQTQLKVLVRLFLKDFTLTDLKSIFKYSSGLSDIQILIERGLEFQKPTVLTGIESDPRINRLFEDEFGDLLKSYLKEAGQ